MIRKKTFGFLDAFTNIGGLLALFGGISVISLIQLLVNVCQCVVAWRRRGGNATTDEPSHRIPNIFTNFSSKLHHLRKDLKDFIGMTSIHGVRNLSKSFGAKIFWSAVIVAATSACVFVTQEWFGFFDRNRVFIEIDERTWSDNEVFVTSLVSNVIDQIFFLDSIPSYHLLPWLEPDASDATCWLFFTWNMRRSKAFS